VGEVLRAGASSTLLEGSIRDGTTDAMIASNSFSVAERAGSGTTGAEGASGFTQHGGVEQLLEPQPVRQQTDFAAGALVAAKTLCQARTNPSRRATAVSATRKSILQNGSFHIAISLFILPDSSRRGNLFFQNFTTHISARVVRAPRV